MRFVKRAWRSPTFAHSCVDLLESCSMSGRVGSKLIRSTARLPSPTPDIFWQEATTESRSQPIQNPGREQCPLYEQRVELTSDRFARTTKMSSSQVIALHSWPTGWADSQAAKSQPGSSLAWSRRPSPANQVTNSKRRFAQRTGSSGNARSLNLAWRAWAQQCVRLDSWRLDGSRSSMSVTAGPICFVRGR